MTYQGILLVVLRDQEFDVNSVPDRRVEDWNKHERVRGQRFNQPNGKLSAWFAAWQKIQPSYLGTQDYCQARTTATACLKHQGVVSSGRGPLPSKRRPASNFTYEC